MKIDLAGRIAIVTGADGGLGGGICRALYRAGARLAAFTRDVREAERLTAELRTVAAPDEVFVVAADLRVPKEVDRAIDQTVDAFGSAPSILVNNAGYYQDFAPIHEMTDEAIDTTIDTNLKGTLYTTRAFARRLIETADPSGSIVNIASGAAHGGRAAHSHYCGSKAGVVGATRAIAIDLAPYDITVNSVSVGFVDVGAFDAQEQSAFKKDILSRILMQRPGTRRDVAAMVTFLVSEHSRWVTGTDFRVDGGESAGRIK